MRILAYSLSPKIKCTGKCCLVLGRRSCSGRSGFWPLHFLMRLFINLVWNFIVYSIFKFGGKLPTLYERFQRFENSSKQLLSILSNSY